MTSKEIRAKYKITSQTLYNWRKFGKIRYSKLPSGSFFYYDPLELLNRKMNVIYSRVSNTSQKNDLERQIQVIQSFCVSNGFQVDHVYSDIGSGMNENRKSFQKMIKMITEGLVSNIFITYKDRLLRFGFGTFEKFCESFNTKIIILNATREEDFQEELTQDLMSIIHHFSMKFYSARRKQLKQFTKILKDENPEDSL